ncbi:unnamed protein product, partial [Adineta steineri]
MDIGSSSSQLDQSPQELYHRHHQVINWTMGSTKQAPSPSSKSSRHKGPSSALQGSMNIIYKHQSSYIMLRPLQGSPS